MPLFNKNKNEQITDISEKSSKKQKGSSVQEERDSFSGDIGSLEINKESDSSKETQSQGKVSLFGTITAKKKSMTVPSSAQKSIPYKKVYVNGIIECQDGLFTKCYKLSDTNFRTARQDKQDEMYLAYGDLVNYFTPDVRAQIVVFNRTVDKEEFKASTLYKKVNEQSEVERKELNRLLLSKIATGQNSIRQEKYLIVTIKADNIEVANVTFNRVDTELSSRIKAINEANTRPMSLEDRLELLYNIYNMDSDEPFFRKMEINGEEATTFNLSWMQKMGITTKDLIAPDDMEFRSDYFKIGDRFGRTLYLRNIPTRLSAEILSDIANVPCNALTSVHLKPMLQDEAVRLVRNQMLEVTRNASNAAKKSAAKGLGMEFISPDLAQEKKDAEIFYDNITEGNQKAILMTVCVTVFADDITDLDKYTNIVKNNADKHLCALNKLKSQQENGFNSCLPLGVNKIWADRLMDTVSASLFIPFESQELMQPNAIYYGVNDVTKNLLLYNRLTAQNSNGLFFGQSGSGKSMSAKMEIVQAYMRYPDSEIMIIDPQGEYSTICQQLGGQSIRIAPSTKTYINPFDMDVSPEANNGDDPVRVKSSYICSICEHALSAGEYGMNPIHITVIDRAVRKIYEPYIRHMDDLRASGSDITCDTSACPTLRDFYNVLREYDEPEAEYIRLAMEKYCIGSYDTFAHHTNVDTHNRLVVYDIRDIGTGMTELGMQVMLNDVWLRCIANKKRKVRTWMYIDELHLLTANESCAKFLSMIVKRCRSFGGCFTGITQNVADILTNKESRAMMNNCQFMIILNQKHEDQMALGEILQISDAQLSHIKNADSGMGLIYTGKAILAFDNTYPEEFKGDRLYQLVSTNPNEKKSIEKSIEEKQSNREVITI